MRFDPLPTGIISRPRIQELPALAVLALALLLGAPVRAEHTLARGAALGVSDALTSPGGTFQMIVQEDGSFAVYPVAGAAGGPATTPVWSSGQGRPWAGTGSLELREDNNLVLVDRLADGQLEVRWESGTAGKGSGPATLALDDQGVLTLTSHVVSIWSSARGAAAAGEAKAAAPAAGSGPAEAGTTPASAAGAGAATAPAAGAGALPAPAAGWSEAGAPAAGSAALPSAGGDAPGVPSFSVGGGRSRVQVSLGAGAGAGARGFSVGGGSSKVQVTVGREGQDCSVM